MRRGSATHALPGRQGPDENMQQARHAAGRGLLPACPIPCWPCLPAGGPVVGAERRVQAARRRRHGAGPSAAGAAGVRVPGEQRCPRGLLLQLWVKRQPRVGCSCPCAQPSLLLPLMQPASPLCRELHSAMRRAYLGPRLDQLDSGCLPDAFEADERAAPECPDLLQLVSGRQVLGAVRERRLELLERQRAAAAALREGLRAAAALGDGEQQQRGPQPTGGEHGGAAPVAVAASSAVTDHQEQQQQSGGSGQQRDGQEQREPDVLDLYIGEEVVASAVRHFPPPCSDSRGGGSGGDSGHPGGGTGTGTQHGSQQAAAAGAGSAAGGVAAGPTQDQQQQQQQAPGPQQPPQRLPAEVIGVYGRGGELLARLEAQQLDPGSSTASSARLLSAAGLHTHTVYRTQTPLVRWGTSGRGGAAAPVDAAACFAAACVMPVEAGHPGLATCLTLVPRPCAGTSHLRPSLGPRACAAAAPAAWWCAARAGPGCRPPTCGCSSRWRTHTTSAGGAWSGRGIARASTPLGCTRRCWC